MATFTDSKGKSWELEINHGIYLKLKKSTALDLDKADSGVFGNILYGTSRELVPVMEVLLDEQIRASALSVEDFHERFTPEVVVRAADALAEAVWDFFHPRQRGQFPTLLASLAEQSTNSVGDSPESWDAIPADGVCVS